MPGSPENAELIALLSEEAVRNSTIPREPYQTFNVKRGLRNADSTGVLVGLTTVGEVHGYIINESEKVAVPGKLFYRGYDIEHLVEGYQKEGRFGFEEVCYLLLFGSLPTADRLESFSKLLAATRRLPDNFTEDIILKSPSPSIMNKLARAVLGAYSYDERPDDIQVSNVVRQSLELIARFPTMVAYGYQAVRRYFHGKSMFLHYPDAELSTAEAFLQMIRPNASFTRLEAELLDLCLILHAEHGGGNNSSFTIHVVTSTDTDTYSAIAAAIGSLKGPKHGGANARVPEMVADLMRSVSDVKDDDAVREYLGKLLDGEAFDRTGLIYGMGHPVYTVSDPRAIILRRRAAELAKEKGCMDELAVYESIERLAPEVFRQKKKSEKPLCANVDLYSGFVYSMMDVPASLFTPLFAVARMPGWCAHRIEEITSGGRVIRPAYKNVVRKSAYVPLNERHLARKVDEK
jgi:citrate synthase